MPAGGVRSSLVGMVNAISDTFRRRNQNQTGPQRDPSNGRGAPILSYSFGGGATWTPGPGNSPDITQFAPVFQPSGGLFAPGYPLVPVEREQTRRWNFPVGYNYIYTPRSYEPIGFAELRMLATHDITRLAIETRKDQIEKLDWTIKPRDEEDVPSNAPKRIDALTDFWRYPDGDLPFASWLRELMEEVLVIDAPALEPRRNRGGDIIGLDIVDGATIKVLIDDTGRRPKPPAPAYEQIIHGRPWVLLEDGSRADPEEGEVAERFTNEQLIYFPRNNRVSRAYGFGPVEQIIVTINTALRRSIMQLQHFTEGNVPPGVMNAPDGWNADQIQQFQEWFDSKLVGNTGQKTRILWGPEGAKYQAIKEAPYKDGFDEWLARIVCFAFSLPPTAFVERAPNRSSSETLQEAALEEGLAPLMGWVKRLVDGIIQRRMGHPDLEFAWATDQVVLPPETQATMLIGLVKDGIITRNEARDERGMDPRPDGDDLMVDTAQGPVLLSNVEAMGQMALNPPEPVQPGGNTGEGGAPGTEPAKPPGKAGPTGKPARSTSSKPGAKNEPGKQGKQPNSGARRNPGGSGTNGKQKEGPAAKKAAAAPFPREHLQRIETQFSRRLSVFFADRAAHVSAQLARELGLEKAGATISQDEADYTDDGPVEAERCRHCSMFRRPNACTLVQGDIHPGGTCRFFEPADTTAKGHVEPENAVPVSIPLADPVTEADVQHLSWTLVREGNATLTERTVPVADLMATQHVVDSERVAHDAEAYREHGQDQDELPIVLERDGKFFVLSGHHHVSGAIMAGAQRLRVSVLCHDGQKEE